MPKALSVQLYTVRDLMAEDRDAVLRRIAELGFDAVEPYQPTVDPVGFRKVADDLGLRVSSAHAMGLIQDEDPGPVFEAIATLGTLQFLNYWNEFLYPLLVTSSADMRTLPVGLATLRTPTGGLPEMLAGTTISIVPTVIVFLFFQRYFIRGIATTGLK